MWVQVNTTAKEESDKSTAHQIANIKKVAAAAAAIETTSNSGGGSGGGYRLGGLLGMMHGGLIQALANGGVVRNILSGGHLPGFGGGDRRLLYGEDGEVMLNKYAVQAGGLKAALAFNTGNWGVVISELMQRFKLNLLSNITPAIDTELIVNPGFLLCF